MPNAFSHIFTPPTHAWVDLNEYGLPWSIDSFSKFCELFEFTSSDEVKPFFKQILEYPLSAQWQNSKARLLVQKISQYDEFKSFLANHPFEIPFKQKQSALEQWILWAQHIVQRYKNDPENQILALMRLLHLSKIEPQTQDHFLNFLSDLRPHFPKTLQNILDNFCTIPVTCPSTQSPAVACLTEIYLQIQNKLSLDEKQSLNYILNFNTETAIGLLGQLFSHLESLPEKELLFALKNKQIEINDLLTLLMPIPHERSFPILIRLSESFPEYRQIILNQYHQILPALSATERQKSNLITPEIAQNLKLLNQPSKTLHETEKKCLGSFKATWINRSLKLFIFADFFRSIYVDLFKRKILNNHQDAPYYMARMDALKTMMHSLNSKALAHVEDSGFNFFSNHLRAIADQSLLIQFSTYLKSNDAQEHIYENLLKNDKPFTSLLKAFTMSIRTCL